MIGTRRNTSRGSQRGVIHIQLPSINTVPLQLQLFTVQLDTLRQLFFARPLLAKYNIPYPTVLTNDALINSTCAAFAPHPESGNLTMMCPPTACCLLSPHLDRSTNLLLQLYPSTSRQAVTQEYALCLGF